MFRPLLSLGFALVPMLAWAQATPPQEPQGIPDTGEARKRHRERENIPPPPEGPWGPEEFDFAWNKPRWRGIFLTGGRYAGASMSLNGPDGLATFSDGVNPPIVETLEWSSQSFDAAEVTATIDFDIFRLSMSYYTGDFDARAVLTHSDGVGAASSSHVNLSGDLYGGRFGAFWPGFRYRGETFEASLGVLGTVGWLHQETREVPGAQLLTRDTLDFLTGSLGTKLSARYFLGRAALEVELEYSFQAGANQGWTTSVSAGIGYKF